MRYAHTSIVARDWRLLVRFYRDVFGCTPVPPSRDLSGEWLARGTGVARASLVGQHLLLPGQSEASATLEVFQYADVLDRPEPVANRQGLAHLAFEVDDVADCLRRVVAGGGSRLGEVVETEVPGVGTLEFTYARDPEGNLVELQSWQRTVDAHRRDSTHEVEDAYDRWAVTYDQEPNTTRDADGVVLRGLLPRLGGLVVLEVGCGTGKNTEALCDAARVLAIDLSEGMLGRARTRIRAEHVVFRRHDLLGGLPGEVAEYDLVTFDLVLEHVRELNPVFKEAARVLRPGGLVLLVEYHPFRQLDGRGARFVSKNEGEVRPATYLHLVSHFVEAALAAGFRVEALQEWNDAGDLIRGDDDSMPRLLSLKLRLPSSLATPPRIAPEATA